MVETVKLKKIIFFISTMNKLNKIVVSISFCNLLCLHLFNTFNYLSEFSVCLKSTVFKSGFICEKRAHIVNHIDKGNDTFKLIKQPLYNIPLKTDPPLWQDVHVIDDVVDFNF